MSIVTNDAAMDARHPGPSGPYSSMVRVGQMIFVSAQPGIEPSTGQLPHDLEAECRQVFRNLAQVLEDAGADLGDIVKTTVFYVDQHYLPTINLVYADVFPVRPPARTSAIVQLAGGRRVVIEAIAVTGPVA